MKKRLLLAGVVCFSLLVVGCGIPQEELDTLRAEKDSIQQELESTQSRLQSTESKLESTQLELDSTKSEFLSIKSDLESTQGELDSVSTELQSVKNQLSSSQSTVRSQKSDMSKASNYVKALNVFLYPVRKEAGMEQLLDFEDESEWLKTLDNIVFNTKDDVFKTIYTEWKLREVDSSLGFTRFLSHIAIMTTRTLD